MRILFLILFLFVLIPVKAAEDTLQAPEQIIEIEKLSEMELLNKAKTFKEKNPQTSIKLANEAIQISKKNNNFNISAQAYYLLGELALDSNNRVQSMKHFIQASFIYKNMEDKRYHEVDKVIDGLLLQVQQDNDIFQIAEDLVTEGDRLYKKKRFDDAIQQYSHALIFLSAPDAQLQSISGEIYKKIAESYKRLKDREKTVLFYKKTLDVFTTLQDQKNMARTLNTLAEAERYLNDYEAALDYSVQALEIYKLINDPEGHAKALNGAGIIYRYIGLYEKSLQYIYEAHLYYNKVNDVSGIAKTSNQMGLIYTRLKQFEQARSFYQLTIDLPRDQVESKTLASALRETAVIDIESGDYESAKKMAKKAYQLYKSSNDKPKQSLTARIIGNVYRAELNINEAIVYYRESLSIATEVGSKIYQVKALTPLAAMLFSQNIDESITLLKKALELSDQIDSNASKLYAYRELRKAEKLRGNYEASVNFAEQEILFTGIIQREREKDDLAKIKAKLYSHKIEMELVALRDKAKQNQLELVKKNNEIEIAEQTSTITELQLTKNKYANFALAFLSVICLLAVIFIYWRFVNSRKRNKELNYLAAHDPLTNCYNRRILFEYMDRDFEDIEQLSEYSIIMADIDHFKAVNDTVGHNVGDAVICGVVNILQSCVRKNDIVTRFGGEEFCIILYQTPKNEALEIAESMCNKVENSRFEDVAVTCSFGVASIRFNAKSAAELINQADLALYKSKSLGRNKVTMWSESLKK